MSTGIRLGNSHKANLSNIRISGFDTGISADNSNFSAENISFDNVMQPWDIQGSKATVVGTRIKNDPKTRVGHNKSHVGWVPQGPAIPARCEACGAVFPSKNYGIRSSQFYGRDNEEVCPNPKCGNEHAKVDEGLFEITEDAVKLIVSLRSNPDLFIALNSISDEILRGDITAKNGLAQLGNKAPMLNELIRRADAHGFNAAWFVGIFIAVAISFAFASYQAHGEPPETKDLHTVSLEKTNSIQRSIYKVQEGEHRRISETESDSELKPETQKNETDHKRLKRAQD